MISTCDSLDQNSLRLPEAVRNTIARSNWEAGCNGLTNVSLANWVSDVLDTYDDPSGLEAYCKTLKMAIGDLDTHRPRTYELAVALLFDDPMGNGHANHSNGGLEEGGT